jgi:hypothetical protein
LNGPNFSSFINYTENNTLINCVKEYIIKDYEDYKSMVEKIFGIQ